ncbi:hypothetical protein ACTFIR_003919 [Dictyostelium discoideum]
MRKDEQSLNVLEHEVTSASDDVTEVQVKSKKTPCPTKDDDDVHNTESTDVSQVEVKEKEPKKSKTNSIETKTIDSLKNTVTSVAFLNIFNIHCPHNVDNDHYGQW